MVQDIEAFEVFVTSLTGCNTPLKMHSDASTNSLYTAVAAKEGFPEDDFRLMFAEKLLERGKLCRHYGIQSESMVDFLEKLHDTIAVMK